MIAPVILGRPGIGSLSTSREGYVFADGEAKFAPGAYLIDGNKSRDVGNAPMTNSLRPGLLMGKVTASGKYANSIIGLTLASTAAGATSLTLSAAAATELVRRVGSTGQLALNGAPDGNNPAVQQLVNYSAVNTTTGVVTTSAIAAATVAGSRVGQPDGSQTPITVIGDGYGITLAATGDTEFPRRPRSGCIDPARLIDYPPDTQGKNGVKTALKSGGAFSFLDDF